MFARTFLCTNVEAVATLLSLVVVAFASAARPQHVYSLRVFYFFHPLVHLRKHPTQAQCLFVCSSVMLFGEKHIHVDDLAVIVPCAMWAGRKDGLRADGWKVGGERRRSACVRLTVALGGYCRRRKNMFAMIAEDYPRVSYRPTVLLFAVASRMGERMLRNICAIFFFLRESRVTWKLVNT